MHIFRCNFAKVFLGMLPDHPVVVVPSALSKLICDKTLAPLGNFLRTPLATRHKDLAILLQETLCTNANQLAIPHFTLVGWISSRKYCFATFVNEKRSWTFVDQSLDRSAIKWVYVNIDGCKTVSVYKLPILQLTLTAIPVFPYLLSLCRQF